MNEQAFFQLSQDAVSRLAERYGTPLLVLSLEQIEKNYDILRTHIADENPLRNEGQSGFENPGDHD